MFCYHSLNPANPKRSPGVVALRPGATLYLPLNYADVGAAAGDSLCVDLWYLTSYEQMGRARLRCVGGCECGGGVLDAHAPPAAGGRNVSIFAEHTVLARVTADAVAGGGNAQCVLEMRVEEDSSSGYHKFKVSDLNVRRARARAAAARGGQGPQGAAVCSTLVS